MTQSQCGTRPKLRVRLGPRVPGSHVGRRRRISETEFTDGGNLLIVPWSFNLSLLHHRHSFRAPTVSAHWLYIYVYIFFNVQKLPPTYNICIVYCWQQLIIDIDAFFYDDRHNNMTVIYNKQILSEIRKSSRFKTKIWLRFISIHIMKTKRRTLFYRSSSEKIIFWCIMYDVCIGCRFVRIYWERMCHTVIRKLLNIFFNDFR